MILVIRCDENPVPYVPSDVVRCARCGAECWISKKTGADTIAASLKLAGEALAECTCCAGLCHADKHGEPDA